MESSVVEIPRSPTLNLRRWGVDSLVCLFLSLFWSLYPKRKKMFIHRDPHHRSFPSQDIDSSLLFPSANPITLQHICHFMSRYVLTASSSLISHSASLTALPDLSNRQSLNIRGCRSNWCELCRHYVWFITTKWVVLLHLISLNTF